MEIKRLMELAGIDAQLIEEAMTRRDFLKGAAAAVASAGFAAPGMAAAASPKREPDHPVLGWIKQQTNRFFNVSPDEIGDEFGDSTRVPVDEIPQVVSTITRWCNRAPEKWYDDSISWFIDGDFEEVPDSMPVEIALDDTGDLRIHATWAGDDGPQPTDW